jgi:hypothetical protein
MNRKGYPRHADFGEILGLLVGGAIITALVSAQVLFVAWII